MRSLASLVAAVTLALAAPAAADRKPPPKDEIAAADAEKLLAFFHKFADAVVQNKASCPKMATAINGVVDAHQDIIKRANELRAAKKRLPKAVEDKLAARLEEMFGAMVKCKDDAAVKAAMRRIDGKPAK